MSQKIRIVITIDGDVEKIREDEDFDFADKSAEEIAEFMKQDLGEQMVGINSVPGATATVTVEVIEQ